MDLSFLLEYINLVTMGICLCLGYAIKNAFSSIDNRYIPLAALMAGCIINIWMNWYSGISAEVILGGMVSGLASTGLYEMFRNLIG